MNRRNWLNAAAAGALAMVGCVPRPQRRLVYLPDREQPLPAADLPLADRIENWTGVNDRGQRGGSCFWASLWNCVRAANRPDIEEILAELRSRGYEGPETLPGAARKLDAAGIPWAATEDGDVACLQAASDSNRWAAIGYYPGHAVNFCGYGQLDSRSMNSLRSYASRNRLGLRSSRPLRYLGSREIAILLDNNFPEAYIVVEDRERFLRSWRELYYGIAIVPWLERSVPRTYPRSTYVWS